MPTRRRTLWSEQRLTTNLEEPEQFHICAQQLAAGELPSGWDVVPSSSRYRVAVNPSLQIYFKEFLCRSPLDRCTAWLLGSPATRARNQSDALLFAGIAAPANLAWGQLAGGAEYLFTRAAAGQDVACWLTTLLSDRTGQALATRRQLLEGLGIFIGRVHASGFIPGTLQAADIMAEQLDDRFNFTLVNNRRTVKKLPPPGRMLLKNLTQLNLLPPSALTRSDRMRFFVSWRRQQRELSPIEAKVIAAEAFRKAMRQMDAADKL